MSAPSSPPHSSSLLFFSLHLLRTSIVARATGRWGRRESGGRRQVMRRRRRSTASRARPPSPPGRSWATAAALSLPGAAAAAEAERRRVVYGSGSQRLWARGAYDDTNPPKTKQDSNISHVENFGCSVLCRAMKTNLANPCASKPYSEQSFPGTPY
uniref:OSJNBa0088I22.9 protein n=1 Tax=Oryza sativa subsp. japonica TaxID=39947 RepID=Q7XU44_ORYSJ|nr:OSJNBa0088I22.9 [Oryza sativa Japonica Group]